MFRQSFRQEAKHYSGYRSSHFSDIRADAKSITLRIAPLGVGRLVNLKEKAQVFCGEAFSYDSKKKEYIPNPMYQYLLLRTIVFQRLTIPSIRTEKELMQEFVTELASNIRQKRIQDSAKALIERVVREVLAKQSLAAQRIIRTADVYQRPRIQKLKFIKAWMIEQSQAFHSKISQHLKNYFNFPENTKSLVLSRKFIEQQLNCLRAIEPLKKSQQYQKFKKFQQQHAVYFLTSVDSEKVRGTVNHFIKIAKLTAQSQPVLQRLSEFVQIRLNSQFKQQYRAETANFIKDLFNELQKYQNITAKTGIGMKTSYYHLNPECVVIDQLSLKPKLHYQPILMETFGLQSSPFSIQSRLAFQPTPKGLDFFQSLPELNEENQLKLKDPFYGRIQMYQRQINKMSKEQQQEIKKQKSQIDKLKSLITVWRFLLIAYYINTGLEYGKEENAASATQIKQLFKKKLKQKEAALNKNAGALKQFLIEQNSRFESSHFQWKLEEIGEYLQFNNDDSVIKQYKFNREYRYFVMRWTFLKQINSILRNPKAFSKVINVKKYIMMYLVSVFQISEESQQLMKAEKKKAGQRKLLRKALKEKPAYIKLESLTDVKTSMDKIKEYLERSETDAQARYLKNSDNYIQRLVNGVNSNFLDLCTIDQSLNQIQNREDMINERNNYKNLLTRLEQNLSKNYNKLKTIITEFIVVEINNRPLQELFKSNDLPAQKSELRLEVKKLVLLFMAYLKLSEDNTYLYESAVVPFLIQDTSLADNLPSGQRARDARMQKKGQDPRLQDKLQAVDAVVCLNKCLPRQFQYFTSVQSMAQIIQAISSQQVQSRPLNQPLRQNETSQDTNPSND